MGLFDKNPNEANYVQGRKHWTDVIKNSGPGELLVWRQPEEDFNTNSTLIVYPSEEAIFFKGGMVQQVFGEGTYKLSTENYPIISRLRNAFSGGISTFNCVVYFVRKAHSMEIKWGTESPIQVRDPVEMVATSVQGRGALKFQIEDSVKFLIKLLGNNIPLMTQEEITRYFRSEFMQHIKANVARYIQANKYPVLGICAELDIVSKQLAPILQEPLSDYGIRLVTFSIEALDIPMNDPSRVRLEAAYAVKREDEIWGADTNRLSARERLRDITQNPGSGGIANMGAGIGMGVGMAGMVGTMAQQAYAPIQQAVSQPPAQNGPSGRFVQRSAAFAACPACGAENPAGAKFCNACGATMSQTIKCPKCGAEMPAAAKFCNECGAKKE